MNRTPIRLHMRKIACLVAMMLITVSAESQLKTYLTMETGPQWSLIKVGDPNNIFEPASVNSSIAGFTIGQELLKNLSLVTGVYYQLYKDGINMKDERPHQSRWEAYTALLIPLRFEYRVQLSEFPVSLTPRIGYVYGIISSPGAPYDGTGVLSDPQGSPYSYSLAQTYGDNRLHMLETGIGLGLRFAGNWQASFNLSYLTGFTDPLSTTLNYTGTDGNTQTASYSTKGNTIYTTLSFHIPVSNIWQLKDYRIRSRIENSTYVGKPNERKGQFYVGTEVGSLWRTFHYSSPAVGSRPMEGKGFLGYANLHTGGYFGYMLNNDLGLDIGVNYQRSSTFYTLMYDHMVNLVIKEPAPMFLEVPLRFRYFYNIYKEKIYYVVYGGASLLTHFSSGDYNTGSSQFTYISPESGNPVTETSNYTATRSSRLTPILRLGTGVEYKLPMEFPLIATLYFNYMHGFLSTDAIQLSNSIGDSPYISYKGSGWSLDVGVKIPFTFGNHNDCVKLRKKPDNL